MGSGRWSTNVYEEHARYKLGRIRTILATFPALDFVLIGDSSLDIVHLWLLWWLGNSVGLLIGGGFGLVTTRCGILVASMADSFARAGAASLLSLKLKPV